MRVRVASLASGDVRYLESQTAPPDAAGGGRAVVWLHAFPLSADQWLPQFAKVPPGWRFVAPDLRGFCGTGYAIDPHGLDDMTMDGYAADVAAWMTHLEIERAVIAGLSMGGYVAMAFARQWPARVDGLILANTRATADSAEARQGRDRMIEFVGREGAAGIAREMTPKLLGATSRREQPELEDAVRRLIEANPPEAIAGALRAMRDRPDATDVLRQFDGPALVVAGDEDGLIPAADLDAMCAALGRVERVTLPVAGHLSNLESPLAFNRAVAAWLARI